MARKVHNPTAETLRELEATGDRITAWAAEHMTLILGTIVGILVIAAGVGLWLQHSSTQREEAANALATTMADFRAAMGADPVSGPIPEPANPQLAERTRSEYAERFAAVGREYRGTTSGSVAWLEAGQLQLQLGRLDEAEASFQAAVEAERGSPVGALAEMRLAELAEQRGDFEAAAKTFEAIASNPRYPLRAEALAEAVRCWAQAGRDDAAIAAFQRLESEFPDAAIAPHIQALAAELRATRSR